MRTVLSAFALVAAPACAQVAHQLCLAGVPALGRVAPQDLALDLASDLVEVDLVAARARLRGPAGLF